VQVLALLLDRPAVAAVAANLAWDLSPGAGQHLVQQTLWALQVTGHLVMTASDTYDGYCASSTAKWRKADGTVATTCPWLLVAEAYPNA